MVSWRFWSIKEGHTWHLFRSLPDWRQMGNNQPLATLRNYCLHQRDTRQTENKQQCGIGLVSREPPKKPDVYNMSDQRIEVNIQEEIREYRERVQKKRGRTMSQMHLRECSVCRYAIDTTTRYASQEIWTPLTDWINTSKSSIESKIAENLNCKIKRSVPYILRYQKGEEETHFKEAQQELPMDTDHQRLLILPGMIVRGLKLLLRTRAGAHRHRTPEKMSWLTLLTTSALLPTGTGNGEILNMDGGPWNGMEDMEDPKPSFQTGGAVSFPTPKPDPKWLILRSEGLGPGGCNGDNSDDEFKDPIDLWVIRQLGNANLHSAPLPWWPTDDPDSSGQDAAKTKSNEVARNIIRDRRVSTTSSESSSGSSTGSSDLSGFRSGWVNPSQCLTRC